jgi:hypothetical protein
MGSSGRPSDDQAFPCHHVRTGRVHRRVDDEPGPVHRPVPVPHGALVVDQDQVGHPQVPERRAERVHPEHVRVLRVAHGDVPGHSLAEAEPAEHPQRSGQLLLAVPALVLDGVEDRRSGQREPLLGGDVEGH